MVCCFLFFWPRNVSKSHHGTSWPEDVMPREQSNEKQNRLIGYAVGLQQHKCKSIYGLKQLLPSIPYTVSKATHLALRYWSYWRFCRRFRGWAGLTFDVPECYEVLFVEWWYRSDLDNLCQNFFVEGSHVEVCIGGSSEGTQEMVVYGWGHCDGIWFKFEELGWWKRTLWWFLRKRFESWSLFGFCSQLFITRNLHYFDWSIVGGSTFRILTRSYGFKLGPSSPWPRQPGSFIWFKMTFLPFMLISSKHLSHLNFWDPKIKTCI